MLVCCGQGTCRKCALLNASRDDATKLVKCPMCRHENMGGSGRQRINHLKRFAAKGEAWAQNLLGNVMMGEDGDAKHKVDRIEARKWYKLAKEQSFPEAIYSLARLDHDGKPKIQELKSASVLGCGRAAVELAYMYMLEQDWNEMMFYATLAIGSGIEMPFLSLMMGLGIERTTDMIGGWEKYYRAKHYLEIGINATYGLESQNKIKSGLGYCAYARVLMHLGMKEYDGWPHQIPGYSTFPKVVYWSSKGGQPDFFSSPKFETLSHCSYCNCKAPTGKRFKHCVKCRAAWCEYC